MTIMITVMTALAWVGTWLIIALRLRKKADKPLSLNLLNAAWLLSLILHGTNLLLPWMENGTLPVSLPGSFSIIMWLTCFLLFITHLNRPLETMGLLIIPFTLLSLLVAALIPNPPSILSLNSGLGAHILLSLLAYSMLALASLQALLLATQNRSLHNHQPNGLIRTLPPLQDMEALLFQLISLGVALLTLSLISGFVYLDGLFGKQVAHKTLLSILAWITFSTLLYGRWQYGWRGRIAIRWTITGFVFLMLAFWGSKFVLEYLVKTS